MSRARDFCLDDEVVDIRAYERLQGELRAERTYAEAITKFAAAHRNLLAEICTRTRADGDMADAAVSAFADTFSAIGLTKEQWARYNDTLNRFCPMCERPAGEPCCNEPPQLSHEIVRQHAEGAANPRPALATAGVAPSGSSEGKSVQDEAGPSADQHPAPLRGTLSPCLQCHGTGYVGNFGNTTCETCRGFGMVSSLPAPEPQRGHAVRQTPWQRAMRESRVNDEREIVQLPTDAFNELVAYARRMENSQVSDYEASGHLFYFPSSWGPGYTVRIEAGHFNGHSYVASQPYYTRKSEIPDKVKSSPATCNPQRPDSYFSDLERSTYPKDENGNPISQPSPGHRGGTY